MRKILTTLLVGISALLSAQPDKDSLRSPFSVYGGGGTGVGILLGGYGNKPHGIDELQFEKIPYVDVQVKAGMLWNEKSGVAILAGQLGSTGDGSGYADYAQTALPGYSLSFEYSDLHSGYTYRYITPQFVYRMGREPFNVTLNVGVGIGQMKNAYGIAIYKQDSTNWFIEKRYTSEPAWNFNGAFGLECAYMRQLSQHWFMNAGISLSYTAVLQKYDIAYTSQHYTQPWYTFYDVSHIKGTIHHAALGLFVQFQWNTKESERAYYE